ncbi:MAG TPA: hypothetical protein QF624_01225 [Dehalococcoidia bacterium]|nr:hypothetical protein [Dehalococcoidia bacterium]
MQSDRLALAAAAIGTAGALIPLVMMIDGSLRHDIDYLWWTWPAIPAVWASLVLGAWLTRARPLVGSMLLTLAATAGVIAFREELGLLTFGSAWLLGVALYLDAGLRRGMLGGRVLR